MSIPHVSFSAIDYIIFILYMVILVSVGLWVSRTKKDQVKTTDDYFLARHSLTWWGNRDHPYCFQYLCGTIHRHVGFGI